MLQVTEENRYQIVPKFKEVLKYCSSLGFEIVLDIAPNVIKVLNINLPSIDFFKELYVNTIRLDEKIGNGMEKKILESYNDIELELNVSTSIEDLDEIIEECKEHLDRIKTSHNFYPQKYTGLPLDHFIKHSLHCKNKGLRVQAFITSQNIDAVYGPWNVNEGLCSLEEHRELTSFTQAQHLKQLGCIDDISFGNSEASIEELENVSLIKNDSVYLNIETVSDAQDIESEILFRFNNHFRRHDINEYTVRSTMSRVEYSNKEIFAKNNNNVKQSFGEIYILNNGYERYKGEVHIVIKEMPYDNRKNLVARINKDSYCLLEKIRPGEKIIFIQKDRK